MLSWWWQGGSNGSAFARARPWGISHHYRASEGGVAIHSQSSQAQAEIIWSQIDRFRHLLRILSLIAGDGSTSKPRLHHHDNPTGDSAKDDSHHHAQRDI